MKTGEKQLKGSQFMKQLPQRKHRIIEYYIDKKNTSYNITY